MLSRWLATTGWMCSIGPMGPGAINMASPRSLASLGCTKCKVYPGCGSLKGLYILCMCVAQYRCICHFRWEYLVAETLNILNVDIYGRP